MPGFSFFMRAFIVIWLPRLVYMKEIVTPILKYYNIGMGLSFEGGIK